MSKRHFQYHNCVIFLLFLHTIENDYKNRLVILDLLTIDGSIDVFCFVNNIRILIIDHINHPYQPPHKIFIINDATSFVMSLL